MQISKELNDILFKMAIEIQSVKYCSIEIISGCYDAMIKHYGVKEPKEGKEHTCMEFMRIFNKK